MWPVTSASIGIPCCVLALKRRSWSSSTVIVSASAGTLSSPGRLMTSCAGSCVLNDGFGTRSRCCARIFARWELVRTSFRLRASFGVSARPSSYLVAKATSSASVPLPAMQSIVADPSAQAP